MGAEISRRVPLPQPVPRDRRQLDQSLERGPQILPIVAIPSDPLPSSIVLGDDFFALIALRENIRQVPATMRWDSVHKLVTSQRYGSGYAREFHRDLHELERQQRMRQGERVPAPAMLDVSIHADPRGADSLTESADKDDLEGSLQNLRDKTEEVNEEVSREVPQENPKPLRRL
jgi:hypothetical protein